MNWVTLDRNTPFRYPQAIECPTCGAMCATEEAAKKHEEWHVEVSIRSMPLYVLTADGWKVSS